MTGAFVILLFTILVGIVLYVFELRWRSRNHAQSLTPESTPDAPETTVEQQECCGQHIVCEKETLSPFSDEIIYYDDEELDRFIGRTPESYTEDEAEEFRDVLMTLLPSDVAGWIRSITQRNIELPPEVRDELFIMVREQRAQK